jgi:hypothetical protein
MAKPQQPPLQIENLTWGGQAAFLNGLHVLR